MSFMMAEYECPAHGRFEMLVDREPDGSAPARIRCMESLDAEHHDMCDEWCDHVISAPKVRNATQLPTAAVRGGDLKERPPGMLDTRPLAEGQSYSEWRKDQAGKTAERRHQQLIKRGVKSRRVQVG